MSGGTGYGITEEGFVLPQLTDLQTDINNAIYSIFGADIDTSAETFFGQISGIMAERFSLVWQAMQDVYGSQTPDSAFGASLDNVGALRGIPRLGAAASVVQNVKLFGTVGTVVPGLTTQFFVQNSPTSLFALNADVTLVAGQNCIQTISFSSTPITGSFVLNINGSISPAIPYNVTASALQTIIQAMNFCSGCVVTQPSANVFQVAFNGAGTGGLMVQPQFVVTDDSLVNSGSSEVTVVPAIVQAGFDQANVTVTATTTGPIIANAGTLNQISTPVNGLTAVLNIQDAVVGRLVESDNAYRTRMAEELQVAGAGTLEAIRSRLLTVSGVTSVLVYENISDVADSNGRPPHCFEAVVNGGSEADIANMLWQVKPAGIATFGTNSYVITDSQGDYHTMKYSTPTLIPLYLIVDLTVTSSYPSDGDTLVKEALANYINSLGQGTSVIVSPLLIAQLASIPGITDATILIGTAPDPSSSDNITILAYQQATASTLNITVNS